MRGRVVVEAVAQDGALEVDRLAEGDDQPAVVDARLVVDVAGPVEDDAAVALVQAHAHQHRNRLGRAQRSEEHTSELQSLMRISYAVFCLKKKKTKEK